MDARGDIIELYMNSAYVEITLQKASFETERSEVSVTWSFLISLNSISLCRGIKTMVCTSSIVYRGATLEIASIDEPHVGTRQNTT